MNNLHDARAWEIVRRLAANNSGETIVYTNLRAEARELFAQVSELEEAKRMIAHLQSIRLGLLEALIDTRRELSLWHGWRLQTNGCDYAESDGARKCAAVLELAGAAIHAAQAGKIPPTTPEAP